MTPTAYEGDRLSGKESQEAKEAAAVLARAIKVGSLDFEIGSGPENARITLPKGAARLLLTMLEEMAEGHAVTVLPLREELSTQEAAELLNVSRPFLVALLEKGDIPFRKVGKHRRVQLKDLLVYKEREDEARRQALDALASLAQDVNLGY